ncbi:MAG: hypothetical protein RBQ94_01115 [Methanimicrococcus sp.]|nr:hypothetical protein [Methanimicrococcus sp.]
MSIEIESEFSEIIKIGGEKYRQISLLEAEGIQTSFAVCDRGISYIPYVRLENDTDEMESPHALSLKPDELIQFHKDPDYEEETQSFQSRGYGGAYDNLCDSTCAYGNAYDGTYGGAYDGAYDSLLPYDYETDVVDALNLDEQIANYAADSWEFVSVTESIILFQKPKWEV